MRRSVIATTVSALALLAAGQAFAQEAESLQVGETISGQLTTGDRRVQNSRVGQFVYDTYTIQARAGQRLEVVMRSDNFDAYLEVYKDEIGRPEDAVVQDDDGLGEGTDSRARFISEAGTYVIRARTLSGFQGGDYTLQLTDRGPAQRAPRPTAIRLGGQVRGELTSRAAVEEDGPYGGEYMYDGYSLRLRQNERVAISLESEDFDPIVRVGRIVSSGAFQILGENDDGPAGGLNSYLVFTAPEAGEYVIRAAALGGSDTGRYTVKVEEAPPPPPTRPVAFGETVEATLGNAVNANGRRADVYSFRGTAGQRIEANMSSSNFDTYLELFSARGGDYGNSPSLAYDDDGADEGTNSRLFYTLPSDGDYVIEARAFGGTQGGAYTFSLTEAEPLPEPTALEYGATVQGEILDGAPRDDMNRRFDAYSITGTAGNRIQVIMRSGDFDTYLQVGEAEGEFYASASDDDGLGEGTNSRLNYILPADGTYIVRASPLYGESKGLYSIELINRGPQPLPGSILVGATARATLNEEDAIGDGGVFYDAYRITVKAGDKLRVTMVSNEFDAYLDIGQGDDDSFSSVISDDDGLSDTHAKVDWTVEEDGEYVIRARSFSSGQSGAYVLTVEPRD